MFDLYKRKKINIPLWLGQCNDPAIPSVFASQISKTASEVSDRAPLRT
jgi:hypothetical protein